MQEDTNREYQPDLPFAELKSIPQKPAGGDAVILFHLDPEMKANLVKAVKLQNLTITGILNSLIKDYISSIGQLYKTLKPKAKTGRGNVNLHEIQLVKEYMRKMHPKEVRTKEIACYVGCSQTRARGLMDLLSGVNNDKKAKDAVFDSKGFLVGMNDDKKPAAYFIFKDNETGFGINGRQESF